MVSYRESDFLIDDFSNVVYMKNLYDENQLVDAYGNVEPFTYINAYGTVKQHHTMHIFNYMRRRVFTGDLVCASNDVDNPNKWFFAGIQTPSGKLFSNDFKHSNWLIDTIPIKSLPIVNEVFDNHEEWLINVTSLLYFERAKAQVQLANLIKIKYGI